MDALHVFEAQRARLRGIAYRMLGSAADAEDAVQDTWLRWQGVDADAVRDPAAFLAATLGRLCVDRLTSAHARRTSYPGTWLPEPVETREPIDTESISLGFLVLLEQLTPVERAVFVLHRVFDYAHAEVAEMLSMSEPAARQAFHRAKSHVAAGRPRFEATRADHQRLLVAFVQALASGDVAAITAVLARDATLYADGGGKVRGAASKPVHGADAIAKFFANLARTYPEMASLRFEMRDVNGWPAFVALAGDAVAFVTTVETDGTHVTTVRNVVAPDKLGLPRLD